MPRAVLHCKMIVFPSPCFAFTTLICVFLWFVVHVPEKRIANIRWIFYFYYYYHYYSIKMVFHRRLSDSKSPQVSRTLLSILAVFNNAVVWIVSTRPQIFKSSRPFNNPLVTVPKAPITIGIIVTFMFHNFFQFSSKVKVLISLFIFFQFYSGVSRDSKVDNSADFLSFVDYYKVWSSGPD